MCFDSSNWKQIAEVKYYKDIFFLLRYKVSSYLGFNNKCITIRNGTLACARDKGATFVREFLKFHLILYF